MNKNDQYSLTSPINEFHFDAQVWWKLHTLDQLIINSSQYDLFLSRPYLQFLTALTFMWLLQLEMHSVELLFIKIYHELFIALSIHPYSHICITTLLK